MARRVDQPEAAKERFEEWVREQAEDHWPGSTVEYRDRARKGSHHWRIRVPELGTFWVAAAPGAIRDDASVHESAEALRNAGWLDRLAGVGSHGVIVKEGGRVLRWDPERDDGFGFLIGAAA